MRFRKALVVFSFIALVLLPFAAAAQAALTLTYANFPPAATFPCVQMERWAKEVEARTAGKVKVQTFPGGTLLGATNMLDGIISGVADIGCFCPSYLPGRFPVSEAVDLPLGFANAKVASMIYTDLVEKYKPKEFEGVKILTVFTCSTANIMSKTPVRSLSDLKGMELRVAGTGADVVKRLGGTPVAMPQSETPDAIQKGVVKGIMSSMEILKDFNFGDSCRFATIVNTHVVSFAVVMNLSKWNALPADAKRVFDELSREQSLWTANYADDHVKDALAWSKEKYNLEIINLPAAEMANLATLMAPMADAYVQKVTAKGIPGLDIVKDVRAFEAKYTKLYP
jgi:TRAP-type C4-dicarboxylate transport system substrate-binding protein